jgi:hypothetical protein
LGLTSVFPLLGQWPLPQDILPEFLEWLTCLFRSC